MKSYIQLQNGGYITSKHLHLFHRHLKKKAGSFKLRHTISPIFSINFKCDLKCSLEIRNDVFDILNSNGHSNQIGRHTRSKLFLRCKLGVCCRGRMDDESLGVTDIGQLTGKLEAVDCLGRNFHVSLDAEGKDASISIRPEKFLGKFV